VTVAWRALVVDDVPRRRFGGLSAALFGMGAAGVQEEPNRGAPPTLRQPWEEHLPPPPPPELVRLRAWFEGDPPAAAERAAQRSAPGAPRWWEDVVEEDWETSWQASFPVLRVSERIVVAPPWDPVPGALIIEPGQGFGTGQHATTRQALTLLDPLLDDPSLGSALDVGMGSGILALIAARAGWRACGVDVDPVAVVDADANAARNGLSADFSTTPIEAVPGDWDVVLANLFAETLVELVEPIVRRAARHLILAGILADREPAVRAAYDARWGEPLRVQDGEWVALHYRAPAPGAATP
jgi:ribosomal protein L11 methyltransferase